MKKTPLIVSGLAAALVVGGSSSAYAMTHEVDVNVYGKSSTVRTFSGTVGDVLEAQGVDVKPTDKVTPSVATPVGESTAITVVQQRPVTVTIDGTQHTFMTSGTSVADALQDFEFDASTATVSPAPTTELSAQGTAITVTTMKDLTVSGQNGSATFRVTEPTLGEAAAAHLTDYQESDTFYDASDQPVAADTPVTSGMSVRIERVRYSEATSTQEIDYKTVTEDDANADKGTTTTKTEGVAGSKDVVTRTKTVDGKPVEETVVSENVTKQPQDKVVLKGTKEAPEPAPAASESQDSSSASSSKDSGSSSKSSDSSSSSTGSGSSSSSSSSRSSSSSSTDQGGTASGDTTTCKASFYGRGDGTDGGPTASGETFNSEAMTAAHKSLPLGTRIRVTNTATGQSVVVRINDRGPYVSGRCLDLSAGAFDAIGDTGAGTMTVTYQKVG